MLFLLSLPRGLILVLQLQGQLPFLRGGVGFLSHTSDERMLVLLLTPDWFLLFAREGTHLPF